MKFTISMHEEADKELSIAFGWYEKQKKGLGEQFLREFQTQVNLLKSNPFLFQVRYKNYRSVTVQTFPYLLIFEIEENIITIYSVFHTSRNPRIWKKRISK